MSDFFSMCLKQEIDCLKSCEKIKSFDLILCQSKCRVFSAALDTIEVLVQCVALCNLIELFIRSIQSVGIFSY